jgi:hypothetical protein
MYNGRKRVKLPSPGLIVAIIALVLALTGTSLAAGLGILNKKAKDKTVGVGSLTYVTTSTPVAQGGFAQLVKADCPAGLKVIGGGIKFENPIGANLLVTYSTPSTNGWSGYVYSGGQTNTAITTAICATSRVVTGAPPAP